MMPGADKVLAKLHPDWVIAIATNALDSTEADIRRALERVNIHYLIDEIYCYRRIGHKKPSPAFFQFIKDHLKLSAQNLIMVGDHYQNDVLGANESGIHGIWYNRQSSENMESDMVKTIHELNELPAMLKKIKMPPA